ncbi:thiamine ABC transporter substrate-binding protein [Cellulomonas alba]|uniref:Thiamine ABC transporter substrate-binding protein n=1 Tax=Cellulomonas alba TaxID=3053467 RepID=A0ABT7SFE7_9CELL|nr:thiamine ABC transporter substrate-binding protein [Cellulomonas alba]MDM7854851.1 thiamine ABC transporter substrate-binding protein [Cellulomonas alba]
MTIRKPLAVAAALAAAASLSACSVLGANADDKASPSASGTPGGTVTLVTHDSFALSKGVLEDFTKQTGVTVKVVQPGDAGVLTNQLVLTKDAPIGDLAYGIDNTYATRGLDAGVFQPYTSTAAAASDAAKHQVDDSHRLTAIDLGDVCINVDHQWFAKHQLAEPATLDDLTKPEYKNLLVVPGAATSSPGLAFLLATIGAYGEDGWQAYWKKLVANGTKVDAGWSDAWSTDFSGGGGDGPRPIVLSYASSPPDTLPKGGGDARVGALLDTCFRQVEYAGVLTGAKNPLGAQKLLDFLLSDEVQADIPGQMYMYPVSTHVTLPAEWVRWAPLAGKPFDVPADEITAKRSEWLSQYSEIVG